MLPLIVYDALFLLGCIALPVWIYYGGGLIYLVTLVVMYVALRAVRKYRIETLTVDKKAVFITGCDTGFGHDLALRLNESGFRVFAGCLFPEGGGANKLKGACPNNLFIVPLDVTDDVSVRKAELFVRDNLGESYLWGFVSNAAVHCMADAELTSMETYERVFGVNFFGAMRVTKAFLPLIRKSKGRVVVVSSVASIVKMPFNSCYAATKCALEGFSDSLRREMVKFGVKISIIQPSSFGANTQIQEGENLKRLYTDAETTWENSSEDVKQTYGKNYTKNCIDYVIDLSRKATCKSTRPVTDAIQDSLLSTNPVYRTIVHGGPYFIDPLAVISSLTNYMSEGFADWLFCKMAGQSDTGNLHRGQWKGPFQSEPNTRTY